MIINIRVDYTIANIETMEHVSKNIDHIFNKLNKKYEITEYVKISTCNRKEFYIHCDYCSYDEEILTDIPGNILIEFDDDAIIHLFRMTSGLESMIVGEDQILGQIKDSKKISNKENHCGKILDIIFTKAIHVGQVVRAKTNINKGHISMGSAAVDLAEEYLGDLSNKSVLVIGAGKMGVLVAKALAEKNLKAIFVANRTYYRANQLAKELNGEAILLDDLNQYLVGTDLIISATGSPHLIIDRERIEESTELINDDNNLFSKMVIIDIANPRDVSRDVEDIGIKLLNIDDLRGIADKNRELRKKESLEAENIINEEFTLLKDSFKLMKIESIIGNLRYSMEDIRQKEAQKAMVKLEDSSNKVKIIDNLTRSIVNKIFYDISFKIKQAAKEEDEDLIRAAEVFFPYNK